MSHPQKGNSEIWYLKCWVFIMILFQVLCKLYYSVQASSNIASIMILTVISAERYCAILHPLRSKQIITINLQRIAVSYILFFTSAGKVVWQSHMAKCKKWDPFRVANFPTTDACYSLYFPVAEKNSCFTVDYSMIFWHSCPENMAPYTDLEIYLKIWLGEAEQV